MKYLVTVILAIFCLNSQAQSTSEDIIKKVKNHYLTTDSFSANIDFIIDIPESDNQIMNGKLYLKGDSYRFTLPNQEIISDDVTLWHWSKDGNINEVQVSLVEDDESIITPSKIFNEYLTGYNYTLIGESNFNSSPVYLVEITPQSINDFDDIFKIKTVVEQQTYQLKEMQIFMKDGIVYTFKVSDEQIEELADSFFKFKQADYSGVEVIDLR